MKPELLLFDAYWPTEYGTMSLAVALAVIVTLFVGMAYLMEVIRPKRFVSSFFGLCTILRSSFFGLRTILRSKAKRLYFGAKWLSGIVSTLISFVFTFAAVASFFVVTLCLAEDPWCPRGIGSYVK